MADGYAKVARSVVQGQGLSGHAKLLYVLLQSHADERGECYPSLALLIEESGWSKPTVIKAIDELVAAGQVERQRRGKTQVNVYRVKLTTFTSQAEVKSTTLTSEVSQVDFTAECSKAPLPVKSSTLTSEVNDVDPNVPHLTRATEREVPETRTRRVAVPPELDSFHAALSEARGYQPTDAMFSKALKYAPFLDLEEEAIKMTGWLAQAKPTREKRQCSPAFVLGWLKREAERGISRERSGARNGHRGRQTTSGDEIARQVAAHFGPRVGDP